MFSLYFIGTFLEKIIGRKRLLLSYVLAGIFASLFFALLAGFFGTSDLGSRIFGNPQIFGVGASGAIFGLLGLLSILTPKNKVYLIVGPLIALVIEAIISTAIPSLSDLVGIIVTLYFFFAIFAMFSLNQNLRRLSLPLELRFWLLPIIAIVPLIVIGLFIALPIGNMAHLGGLIAGVIYGSYLRKKYPNKTALISRLFSK
jgi:membrane associated rhomboid family serine protease